MFSPEKKYPLEQINRSLIFLKNFITNPNIIVGDYTYYACNHRPEDFEKENVIFALMSKLTIGKFCQIAEGTKFLLSDANHDMSGFSTYPFFIFGKYNEECSSWQDYPHSLSEKGDTVIGNDVWFGHQSLIMPGV